MQTFNISFLIDKAPLCNSALLMQSDMLNSSVLVLPRKQLDEVVSNDTVTALPQRGVYVLYGQQHVYVGKTNQGLGRIKQHDRSKDFWQVAVLFLSTAFDEEMIAGLEAETIAYMQQQSKFVLENKQLPQHQYAHVQTRHNVRERLRQFRNVLDFLMHKPLSFTQTQMADTSATDRQEEVLKLQSQVAQLTQQLQSREQEVARLQQELQQSQVNVPKTEPEQVFTFAADSAAQPQSPVTEDIPAPLRDVLFLQIGNITAKMSYRGEKQWVVLAGSQLRVARRKDEQLQKTIAEAKENRSITEHSDGFYVTNVDFSFTSPSAAMAFVYGFGMHALDRWHNTNGVTLRELLAQAYKSVADDSADQPQSTATPATEDIPAPLRDVLIFQARNLTAKLSFRGEKQWVVLAGSQLRGVDRNDTQVSTRRIIAEAKQNHELTEQADGSFVIKRDFYCKTPSAALALVLGGEGTNALSYWHNEAGVPLKVLLAQSGLEKY